MESTKYKTLDEFTHYVVGTVHNKLLESGKKKISEKQKGHDLRRIILNLPLKKKEDIGEGAE